jgi:hypothetical protein
MTKLGYPLLPVIERAEVRLGHGLSGSERASLVSSALGVLIVLCIAFPICLLGFTALTTGTAGMKHATLAHASSPPSVFQDTVPGLQDHGGHLGPNQSDSVTLATDRLAVTEAPVRKVAPISTDESILQTDETLPAARKESDDALGPPAEVRRAGARRMHQSQRMAAATRKSGKEKHKTGNAHTRREMKIAADETRSGKSF